MYSVFDDDPLYLQVRELALELHELPLEPPLLDDVRQSTAALYLNTVLAIRADDAGAAARHASCISGKVARLAAALELATDSAQPDEHRARREQLRAIHQSIEQRFR